MTVDRRTVVGQLNRTVELLESEIRWREEVEEPLARPLPKDVPDDVVRRRLLGQIFRVNPKYQAGWFHRELCQRMEQFSRDVAAGKSPRLLITVPPRHGKSEIVSRHFPVWHLGQHPDHEVVVAAYGQELADKMSRAARRIRDEVLPLNPALTPGDTDGVRNWLTAAGGGYQAVGVGGPLTGAGAHILIIDDPVKDRAQANSATYRESTWEWYQDVASTRIAPGGGVIVMATRWHDDDLIGRLLKRTKDGEEDWEIVNYPALAEEDEKYRAKGEALHPERYDREYLEGVRRKNPRGFAALYQQRPTPAQGGTFKKHWWGKRYTGDPRDWAGRVLITVDCTFKKSSTTDYVGIVAWGADGPELRPLEVTNRRMGYVETRAAVVDVARRWGHLRPNVYIEDAANGPAILDDLKRVVPNLIPFSPGGDSKESRAEVAAGRAEAGQIILPDYAPWLDEWLEQHHAFPASAHDDLVDCTSMAVLLTAEGVEDFWQQHQQRMAMLQW